MLQLSLPASLATSLASGHPWVYRDHVGSFRASTGSWVEVRAGTFTGVGLWDDESPIAVRLFSMQGVVDASWVRQRVVEAFELRRPLRDAGTNGYRWIFGEADQLPGIVVDLYGTWAVVVTYSKALGTLLPWLVEALAQVAPLDGIARRLKLDDSSQLVPLWGQLPPQEVIVHEGSMQLAVDLYRGQKTGLFFDHRDNRRYVGEAARGADVLNLFSYTGGFSVAAALGGAVRVTSVDVAGPAIAACERNLALNGLAEFDHRGLAQDAFAFLEQAKKNGDRYDLVVCDPPSFARNRQQLKAAERAYRKLMASALAVTSPSGLFCGASCTSQVSPASFARLLADAARKARVRLQVVRDIGQPIDHPVAIGHEEGRYLKFVAGRVLPRC